MINLLTSNTLTAQLFRNFLIGGTIISSVSYLTTFVNPLIASIWWSYPISILPPIYFMKANGKTNEQIYKFLLSITFVLIISFGYVYLLSYYIKNSKSKELTMPILKSTGWWIAGSAMFYLGITKGGYKKYFV
jgi:hypothetical protein